VQATSRYVELRSRRHGGVELLGRAPAVDDGRRIVGRDPRLPADPRHGERHDAPPVLSVFGGKITTYRRLAEHVLDRLAPHFRR